MDGVCIYARCVARFENCARAADESVLMRRREQCIDDDRRLRTLLKLASWSACNTRSAVQISDVERRCRRLKSVGCANFESFGRRERTARIDEGGICNLAGTDGRRRRGAGSIP